MSQTFKIGDKVRLLNGDKEYVGEIVRVSESTSNCEVKFPDVTEVISCRALVPFKEEVTLASAQGPAPAERRQVYIDTCHIKPLGLTVGVLLDIRTREVLVAHVCTKPFECPCAETYPAMIAMQQGYELVRTIEFAHNKPEAKQA